MGAVVLPAAHGIPTRSHEDGQPAVIERVTKTGRRLFYQLSVIQQPDRARACGSGPKSSADRRPVDPPPVVELRIFEGPTWAEARGNDITFLYNANFFLFATLEHARVMAHGRVQTPAANQPPVLTGVPVSGMAYLDRPVEAGYFLFPDLSVRHEGRYRLVFQLYEETKEDKDRDPDTPDLAAQSHQSLPSAGGESFDYRLEVKSCDFIVWSAKKFPGLKESTQLSRVISEQGCRVRIRRDVRMRRRADGKANADYETGEDEYARRRRTPTPEISADYRARSMSGSSERRPFVPDHSPHRPAGAEYPPHFAPQPSAGNHLKFLGNPSGSQYPPQPQSYSQAPPMPPSPSQPTGHGPAYGHLGPHARGPHAPYAERPPPPAYGAPVPQLQPAPHRRPSEDIPRHELSLPPLQGDFSRPGKPGSHISLPPILPSPPGGRSDTRMVLRAGPSIEASPPGYSTGPPPATRAGSKRSRDETFHHDDDDKRYHNGTREAYEDTIHEKPEPAEPGFFARASGAVTRVFLNY